MVETEHKRIEAEIAQERNVVEKTTGSTKRDAKAETGKKGEHDRKGSTKPDKKNCC